VLDGCVLLLVGVDGEALFGAVVAGEVVVAVVELLGDGYLVVGDCWWLQLLLLVRDDSKGRDNLRLTLGDRVISLILDFTDIRDRLQRSDHLGVLLMLGTSHLQSHLHIWHLG